MLFFLVLSPAMGQPMQRKLSYHQALAIRQQELERMQREIKTLPQLTEQVQALERQYATKTGEPPSKVEGAANIKPRVMARQNLDYTSFSHEHQHKLEELDFHFKQLEPVLLVLSERQIRIQWLEQQLARTK